MCIQEGSYKEKQKMNFFFRLLTIPLAVIILAACDSVNTDQAEKSTLDQYQRTNSGTFPAQVHVQNYRIKSKS